MSSSELKGLALKCLETIKKKEGVQRIRSILEMAKKNELMKWKDDNDMDVLHNAIICNNPEVVEYFLTHGYFQEPFQPDINPYLHLAAHLGHRSVLNTLLSHRPGDNRPSQLLVYPKKDVGMEQLKHTSKVTPLDVAATRGQVSCVHMILNQCVVKAYPDFASSKYLVLATLADSPKAVRCLLKEQVDQRDALKAIELAVHNARAECLDLLLGTGITTKKLFQNGNPFHILYSYSAAKAFGREGYRRLPAVTEVLIKHKYSVNTKIPAKTYPMYSLLRNSLCIHDYINTMYYMECLQLLLDAGADPNFDEVKHEVLLRNQGHKATDVVGRQAYSSALHCLMDTVEIFSSYLESKALAVKFVTECSDILLRNAAKVNSIGRLGDKDSPLTGTLLHHYAKSSIKLGVDDSMLRYFLRQGANPNLKVVETYPINTFINLLFATLREIPDHKETPNKNADVDNMIELCRYMSAKSIQESYKIFLKGKSTYPPKHVSVYSDKIQRALESYVKQVSPLKRLCVNFIWQRCGRCANNVHALPVHIKLKTDILPLV